MTATSEAADTVSGAFDDSLASPENGKPAFRYKAFISYRHTEGDRQLAQWLHSAIETYRTPRRMVDEGFSARLGVVFRDEEELSASADLSGAIEAALQDSEFLVVICSPRTPASRWVNEEITRFRQLGREKRILACLIEGEPAQAFPLALHEMHGKSGEPAGGNAALEPLAADFRPASGLSQRRLLVRRSDNAVALYDLEGGRLVRRFAIPGDAADVKFSGDGKAIVGSNRAAVRLWDAVDGRMTREIVVDAEPDFVALGGADGTYFVVTGTLGAVKVIDLQTGRPPFVLGETFAAPVDVAIDASGDRAIIKARERDCSDVAPSLWDLRKNRKVASFPVSQGCPYRFAFSADGAQVVGAVSEPYRLAVWESAGGGALAEFETCLPEGAGMGDGDASQVMAAGFSDDNRYLYAGTLGGGVCIWPNPGAGPALVARAKQDVPRRLTPEERKRFFLEGPVP